MPNSSSFDCTDSTPLAGESLDSSSVALAVDLGASSGRVVAGLFNGTILKLVEVHRFPTKNMYVGDSCYWDILFIYSEILKGLKLAGLKYGGSIRSVGVDSWGVDYALLEEDGSILGNPHHYRDSRTDGMREEMAEKISETDAYAQTGIQPKFFNSVIQLLSEVDGKTPRLGAAAQLLFIPDLINYWLSGVALNERTIASTSGMLNPSTGKWADDLLSRIGIPSGILGSVVEPGTILGGFTDRVAVEVGADLNDSVELIAVGSHDTASAVAGMAVGGEGYAFLSSGTWSMLGMEISSPVLDEEALAQGFSNEAGVGGSIRFLKNLCGLWLVQECRAQWLSEGEECTFAEMATWAEMAEPFFAVVDSDDPIFAKAGNMPNKIRDYCADTGQRVPTTHGQILRIATESLAAKYRIVWESLQAFSKVPLVGVNVVGGGCQNDLLNQCTANALGVPLVAGPVEATAVGNLVTQLLATEQIATFEEGREVVRISTETKTYEPQDMSLWSEYVEKLKGLQMECEV